MCYFSYGFNLGSSTHYIRYKEKQVFFFSFAPRRVLLNVLCVHESLSGRISDSCILLFEDKNRVFFFFSFMLMGRGLLCEDSHCQCPRRKEGEGIREL